MAQQADSISLIPSHLADSKRSGKNPKFIAAGLLLIGLVVVLIVQGLLTTGAYFMTVGEVQAAAADLLGKRVRVNGAVAEASEEWNPQAMTLKFAIQDENGAELPIVFYGPRPDNFQRAASAIVEGELLADGTFQADTLLLKCPSRYEEEPEEIFVRSTR